MADKTPNLTEAEKKAIKKRDNNKCLKCGRSKTLVIHHIVERYLNGPNDPENLATLCSSCHQEWHGLHEVDKISFEEWLTFPSSTIMINCLKMAKENLKNEEEFTLQDFFRLLENAQRMYLINDFDR